MRAERLAAGQPLEFTKSLSKEVRTKISWAMLDSSPAKVEPGGSSPTWTDVGSHLQRILLKKWGRTTGLTTDMGIERSADVTSYLINNATDEEVLDIVEAWFDAVVSAVQMASRDVIKFARPVGAAWRSSRSMPTATR